MRAARAGSTFGTTVSAMRLGLNLGYLVGSDDPHGQLRLTQHAEATGCAVVWAAEAYGSDSPTVLAWLAAQTSTIELGSAVMQIPARTPAMTAMTAASLDVLTGGRFRLGLGVSGPQVSEGWHGVRFDKPLARTREYIAVVSKALSRSTVTFSGEHYQLPLPDGPGKPLKLTIAPVSEHIPIYLAAVGPKNLELAGELADGWLAIFYAPEFAPSSWTRCGPAATRVGKDLGGFDVVPSVPLVVGADPRMCADQVRSYAALYFGGMGSREEELLQRARGADGLWRSRGNGAGPVPEPEASGRHGGRPVRLHRPDLVARRSGPYRRPSSAARWIRSDDLRTGAVRRLRRGEAQRPHGGRRGAGTLGVGS